MKRFAAALAVGAMVITVAACGSDPAAEYDEALVRVDFSTAALGISGGCLALGLGADAIATGEAPNPATVRATMDKARRDIPKDVAKLGELVAKYPDITFPQDNGDSYSLNRWLFDTYAGACTEAQVALEDAGLTGRSE